jgi:hypothetical protein
VRVVEAKRRINRCCEAQVSRCTQFAD